MKDIISEFNSFFDGQASVVINDNVLEITIGLKTLLISLPKPEVIGGQSMGLSHRS